MTARSPGRRHVPAAAGDIELQIQSNGRVLLALSLALGFLSACSLNPNVRKQKDFENGQAFFEKGQYAAAATEFSKAIKIDPSFADAHYQLGQAYMLMEQPDHAIQIRAVACFLWPGAPEMGWGHDRCVRGIGSDV